MTIIELSEKAGLKPKMVTSAGEYSSACPNCGGSKRFRMWVNNTISKNRFWCRECDIKGDEISFARNYLNMTFIEACKYVGKTIEKKKSYVGKTIENKNLWEWKPKIYKSVSSKEWLKRAKEFVNNGHEKLLTNKKALDWLYFVRGISLECVKKYKLGLNDRHYFRTTESWGLPDKIKDGKKKKLWIPKGLIIPCINKEDEIIRIRIRCNSDMYTKYFIVPGSSVKPMLLSADSKFFVIVESELDGFLIENKNKTKNINIVALGNNCMKPDIFLHEKLKKALIILIALDYDEAGYNGSIFWLKEYKNAIRYPVPVGKDPTDLYQKGYDVNSWIQLALEKKGGFINGCY